MEAIIDGWGGVARRTAVKLGHRGAFEIEMLQGLKAGDAVIVHPSSDVSDGAHVSLAPVK